MTAPLPTAPPVQGIRDRVVLYHWSPTERRASILANGLRPGEWTTDRLFRTDSVCFGLSPMRAWTLSGATNRGQLIDSWDLWLTDTRGLDLALLEPRYHEDHPGADAVPKEYRHYAPIPAADLWLVATRITEHLSRPEWGPTW